MLADLSDHITCLELHEPIFAEDALPFGYSFLEFLLWLLERLQVFGFYVYYLTWLCQQCWIFPFAIPDHLITIEATSYLSRVDFFRLLLLPLSIISIRERAILKLWVLLFRLPSLLSFELRLKHTWLTLHLGIYFQEFWVHGRARATLLSSTVNY